VCRYRVALVASAVSASVTLSGCIISRTDQLSVAEPCLHDGDNLTCCMSASPDRDTVGAMFLPTYTQTGFPFSIALRLSDYVHGYSEIAVTGVDIEYGSNSADHVELNETGLFTRNEVHNCGQAEFWLNNVVRRRGATAITIIGEFRTPDGNVEPFRMRREVQLDSNTELATWYDVIASC
jgi:hypothetical protein